MKKKVITKNSKTLEEIMNPYRSISLNERLAKSNAIDLTDNYTLEEEGDYMIIKPIDESKKIKTKRNSKQK